MQSTAAVPRHQPSSPRRHRSRHHAVCIAWLSAGLRTHGHEGEAFSYSAASQGLSLSADVAGSFPITAAGQCRNGHEGITGFPFNPVGANPPEPTGHKIVGVGGRVNTKCGGFPSSLAAQGLPLSLPDQGGRARPCGVRSPAVERRCRREPLVLRNLPDDTPAGLKGATDL